MSQTFVVLTPEQKEELELFTSQYVTACDNFAAAEANKKALNITLKNLFEDYGLSKFETSDGKSFSVTTQKKTVFDEDKLLAFCKQTGIEGLVKTREYVDMDALESALYNHKISSEKIRCYQIQKPDVVTLRYTQKKKLNE